MKASWRIGHIAGIGVYIHFTFLILLAIVGISAYSLRQEWIDALMGLSFICCLFGIVVLHELGHALAARRYGIQTKDITLLPIGGVARLERMPEKPAQELVVALAGPAVNFALAGILYGVIAIGSNMTSYEQVMSWGGTFLDQLLWVNILLGTFNLLPAFPMDGGRVLRALLAMRLDYVRATRIAAGIGQMMALLFGFIGLSYGQPMLVLVAVFVWMGAAGEASMVQVHAALKGFSVSDAMIRDFHVLHPNQTLRDVMNYELDGFQSDFPITRDGHLVGLLTRKDLISGLAKGGPDLSVREVMEAEFPVAHPNDQLDDILRRMQESNVSTMPVVSSDRLIGLITTEKLINLLMIREATQERLSASQTTTQGGTGMSDWVRPMRL